MKASHGAFEIQSYELSCSAFSLTHTDLCKWECYMLISFPSLGRMPTTVLGKVYSPDPDDWDNKTYVFEGHVPR